MPVHRRCGDAGRAGDVRHRHLCVATLDEERRRGVDELSLAVGALGAGRSTVRHGEQTIAHIHRFARPDDHGGYSQISDSALAYGE